MANQAEFPVQVLCRVLKVSRSAYYAWSQRKPSARQQENTQLIEEIRIIHAESDATYGMPRIRAELMEQGWAVSRRRVARLMRLQGLRGVCRRRYQVTTRRDLRQPPAPDLVKRQFVADEPNQLWVADATFVPTGAGFIYLAIVLDVWSRRVVGWAIGESLVTELMLDALNMALEQRQPENVIHHSDQGCQYTSFAFSNRCKAAGVKLSMGSVGDAYDNAMAESFFASLECELLDRRSFKSKSDARLAVFTWIEAWYNPKRRHSSLDYVSPIHFERKHLQKNDIQPDDSLYESEGLILGTMDSVLPSIHADLQNNFISVSN
ncbi:integrase catalytic subunit [Mycoavidus cysteinexigens]|uniref:Integrase catalytic subunit n=1 Tax=Mycoavidus cysteinexigens TaxID=1553431 RepID=A0A2Z6EXF5_9BURK|nr:integrase catalytic subunit [Mycoavidus cysteinexigens]BBE09885.1 integrase catalytic subunit [Mycoavidus cysteinexigens]